VPHSAGLDRAGFEALFERLEGPVYNVVYRWVWDSAEAADIVQEAFVRLWAMRDRVRPATAEPLVYRVALNLAANRRRKRKLWGWVGLDGERADDQRSAPQQLERAERDRQLRAAVEALPEKLRRVVMLCEFSELSYQQVADALNIKVGTVGSRRSAALARLRVSLGREVADGS
jgi:RNA polymerase sigma factor (sigma-70 family)